MDFMKSTEGESGRGLEKNFKHHIMFFVFTSPERGWAGCPMPGAASIGHKRGERAMTTMLNSLKKCGCCGKEVRIITVGSTNTFFGTCDLDLRPPEMMRSAMFAFLQICPECGYTAWDLEEKIKQTDELKKILAEPIRGRNYVQLFDRAARIAALPGGDKDEVKAFYLRAAWAADDQADAPVAVAMRKKVLANTDLKAYDALKPKDYKDAGNHGPSRVEKLLQLVDIARRAGERETANLLLGKIDEDKLEQLPKKIAAFQKKLLADGDTACYTVGDVEQQTP